MYINIIVIFMCTALLRLWLETYSHCKLGFSSIVLQKTTLHNELFDGFL
jgi:hypothetical protein